MFSTRLEGRSVTLFQASDAVLFSFIVQNSISYLDLQLCQNARISFCFRHECGTYGSKLSRYFASTEEKCRKIFAHNRSILYTLHLDLPKDREVSLKENDPKSYGILECYNCPHTSKIELYDNFHYDSLFSSIEEALSMNIPKIKILKGIVKFPFNWLVERPLLSYLEIGIASKFIDCFYPIITDSALFSDFLKQFNFVRWMQEHEQPEILEYLLYHACLLGKIRLFGAFGHDPISTCIFSGHYLNVKPILKYISDSRPTINDFDHILFSFACGWLSLSEDAVLKVRKSRSKQRMCLIMQIIWVHDDRCYNSHQSGRLEYAQEALRLTWCSTPDPYVTLGELKDIFGGELEEEKLTNIHDFYAKAIGEFHEFVEPRSLQHLSRTAIRRALQEKGVWIPDGVSQLLLPNSLKSFLTA